MKRTPFLSNPIEFRNRQIIGTQSPASNSGMPADLAGNSGQALLEFSLTLPIGVVLVVGAVFLFQTEWNRTRCAYQVFQAAHRALRENSGTPGIGKLESVMKGIRTERTAAGVTARARCGAAEEEVRLPDLEEAQW